MRGNADLQDAALIVMNVKPELAISGKLLTWTALASFGRDEIKINNGEEEGKSADRLVIPKFPDGTGTEEQGSLSSGKNQKRDDKETNVDRKNLCNRIQIRQERMTIRLRQVGCLAWISIS